MGQKFLYETHMHTSESSKCGQSSAAQQVRAYKKRGYSGIIITDHFINGHCTCPRHLPWHEKMRHSISGYTAAKKEGDKCGLDVFLGWEFYHKGLEFLTYGLGLDFLLAHPDIDKKAPAEYSSIVRENGGYIAQAHPYRTSSYIINPGPVDPSLLDGIEVFNASEYKEHNRKAFEFAKKHGLPMQAGSDSHSTHVEYPSGIAMQKKAESIHDIIAAITSHQVELLN